MEHELSRKWMDAQVRTLLERTEGDKPASAAEHAWLKWARRWVLHIDSTEEATNRVAENETCGGYVAMACLHWLDCQGAKNQADVEIFEAEVRRLVSRAVG